MPDQAELVARLMDRSISTWCRIPVMINAEVARLEALGATGADVGQGDVSWTCLADPEGNEFRVLAPG